MTQMEEKKNIYSFRLLREKNWDLRGVQQG